MLLNQALEVGLEHFGDLNRKLLDAQCRVPLGILLALAALLQGVRRWLLLLLVHGQPLRFHVLANQAMPAACVVALG